MITETTFVISDKPRDIAELHRLLRGEKLNYKSVTKEI